MRGRKPTSTTAKLIRHTLRGSAKSKAHGVTVIGGPVKRPGFLTARESKLWDEYAPPLIAAGVLTAIDTMLFSCWCQLAAEAQEGKMVAARLVQFRAIASCFGMEPSSRARLGLVPDAAIADLAEDYFGGNVTPLRRK